MLNQIQDRINKLRDMHKGAKKHFIIGPILLAFNGQIKAGIDKIQECYNLIKPYENNYANLIDAVSSIENTYYMMLKTETKKAETRRFN